MAQGKKKVFKKKKFSDRKMDKIKRQNRVKVNPFEIKINRKKHDVLNEKTQKYEVGKPGVSRAKAEKKRKEILMPNYQNRHKTNQLVDRRLLTTGDIDEETKDKNIMKKFTIERQKHNRSTMYNLNDDTDLTHYGQSLSEIEQFIQPFDDYDNIPDDEEDKMLPEDFVAEEHFGGFQGNDAAKSDPNSKKSYEEKLEDIIIQSKERKREKFLKNEKISNLQDKVDSDWDELRNLLSFGKEDEPITPVDDYTRNLNEMRMEARAQAKDKMKTEEEIAREEHERLRKLEDDRMKRMRGIDTKKIQKSNHRSADALDDFYKPVNVGDSDEEEENEEEDSKDNEEFSGSDEEGEDMEEDVDMQEAMNGVEEEDDYEKESIGDASEEEESEMSDLEAEDDDEEMEGDDDEEDDIKETCDQVKKKEISEEDKEEEESKKQKIIEKASKELPYTFKVPRSVKELTALLSPHKQSDQILILQRIRKSNHPSIAEGNKEKLQTFYGVLIEYYCSLCTVDHSSIDFTLMDALSLHLYHITQLSPIACATTVNGILQEKHERFVREREKNNQKVRFPSVNTLFFLKLIPVLFPTSDFYHFVSTRAMLYMSEIMTQSSIVTRRGISSGLFVCTLFLEYISLSQRFVPEAINYLCGVLFLASKKDKTKLEPVVPPFKQVGRSVDMLVLENDASAVKVEPIKLMSAFCKANSQYLDTDQYKVCVIYQCLQLLQRFSSLYQQLPSFAQIFERPRYFIGKLPLEKYPQKVKDACSSLYSSISSISPPLLPLTLTVQKPQPIKQLTPAVEHKFDGRKHHKGDKKVQHKIWVNKMKRDEKSAIREIRKDSQFISKIRLNDQIKRDNERKEKTKRIVNLLSQQEGESKRRKF